MAQTIYQNNSVEITLEFEPPCEYEVKVNGQNLIWISSDTVENFKKELSELLDRHRI